MGFAPGLSAEPGHFPCVGRVQPSQYEHHVDLLAQDHRCFLPPGDLETERVDDFDLTIGPLENLGVKRFTRTIYGFKYAKMPSILIEGGFMTNEVDLSVIMDISKQKLLARLIVDAIVKRLEAFD